MYETLILTVILYGYETWSLTLRKEQRQRVWEQGTKENIWTEEGLNNRILEEITQRGAW
jgi:hypothetical protein